MEAAEAVKEKTVQLGTWLWRGVVALSVLTILALVRPVNHGLRVAFAGLHNWAGPAGDRAAHTRHAGPAIRVPHGPAALMPHSMSALVIIAYLVAVAAVWKTRQNATTGGKTALVVSVCTVLVVAVGWAVASQSPTGRHAMGAVLQATAWVGGILYQLGTGLAM